MPGDVLPFWVADMDFKTPDPVTEELVRRSRHGIFGYTEVGDDYRAVLSAWFDARHGWRPDMKSLVVTPGVVFAICAAIRAFTNKGDGVLICPPVYYPFAASIRDNGRRPIESPLREKQCRYEIDFEDFEKKIAEENVRLFLLCSPHNPVGRVWTRDELSRAAEICLRYGVIVVADEIHQDFIRPSFRHTVFASQSTAVDNITVTCTSPSKTFNLAGLQISNVFVKNDDLRQRFRAEITTVGYSQPNALGLFAAAAAYEHGAPWLSELLSYIEGNIRFVKDFLARELPRVRLTEPEGTYLLWLDFSDFGLSDDELDDIIIHKGKLWFDGGRIFGTGGDGRQRINIACPRRVLEDGLMRLARCFK